MIGLGSNRLSVCRRGGMSVTQAGKGGMEWLAGGRLPSWANPYLPYSKAAGEALVAQFPTQWPTIRDYGFAHPEIVGYMNAYAPEDPKIAYSLVPTLGKVRGLFATGTQYIMTDIIARSTLNSELTALNITRNAGENILYGSDEGNWSNMYGVNYSPNNNKVIPYIYYDGVGTRAGLVSTAVFTLNQSGFYINGEQYLSKTPTARQGTRAITIFAENRAGSIQYKSIYGLANLALTDAEDNDSLVARYIPYESRANGKGVIDLVRGGFFGNSGTGDFTIQVGTIVNGVFVPDPS